MNWIKENKFLSTLLAITLLIACVILYFGFSQGSAYNKKMERHDELKNEQRRLNSNKPYPNKKNLQQRKVALEEYKQMISQTREKLGKFYPGELPNLTPEEFSDARLKMEKELLALFSEGSATLPENCRFGFEAYADVQAKPEATSKLGYELGAIQWLLKELALLKPQALINVNRTPLAVERDEPEEKDPRKRRRPNPRASKNKALYEYMPMELSFTAAEPVVRDFLKKISNSEQYFYAIHSLRITNEKQTLPTLQTNKKDSKNNKQKAKRRTNNNLFAPAPAKASSDSPKRKSGQLLTQLLGLEKLHVCLALDILLVKQNALEDAPNKKPEPARN